MLEANSPGTLCTLLYRMRRAFETVWRVRPADARRAPQLAAPQWQLLPREHNEACELAVRTNAVSTDVESGGVDGRRSVRGAGGWRRTS